MLTICSAYTKQKENSAQAALETLLIPSQINSVTPKRVTKTVTIAVLP
jgi:hypothetical protein